MSTTAPEQPADASTPSMFAEPAGKSDTPSGDLAWSLPGNPPAAAHFPTDEERKILADMAAAEKIEEEKAAREKAEKALTTARKKAATAERARSRS